MIEQLFGSRTRVKLLGLFLTNEEREFFVREITRKIDEQINSVRRELKNLKDLGLLTSKGKNGKLFYTINKNSELFPDLKKMFEKIGSKKEDERGYINELKKLGSVNYAALLGVFVGDSASRVDFFLVGDVDRKKLAKIVQQMEAEVKKEINYSVLSYQEYRDREMLFDRFINEVMSKPKEVIVDNL